MILVVGATGLLGSEVCRRLADRGLPVRGLLRPQSPGGDALKSLGVAPARGDLEDPSSLRAACRGVDAIVSTATATAMRQRGDRLRTIDRDGQLALVTAAREAGVRRFIYVSLSPNLPGRCHLVRYKREVERAVRESGISWCVLQPSCFMEIWLGPRLGWDAPRGRAVIFGSGREPVSYVSVHDVAAVAVAALEHPGARDATFCVGGPEAVSPLEALRTFERLTGRTWRVKHVPAGFLRAASFLLRPVDPVRSSLMDLGASVAQGDVLDVTGIRQLGIPLTSVEQYAMRSCGPAR